MQYSALFLSTLAPVSALSLEERQNQPFQITSQRPWIAGAVSQWQVHQSYDGSQRAQLQKGLDEAVELATHAKAHMNQWVNESAINRRWFGNRPTVDTIGSLDIPINGDRQDAVFRCDDPDGNCVNTPTYGGHYCGSIATEETVICGLSFRKRQYNSQICSRGGNARQSSRLLYWSSHLTQDSSDESVSFMLIVECLNVWAEYGGRSMRIYVLPDPSGLIKVTLRLLMA